MRVYVQGVWVGVGVRGACVYVCVAVVVGFYATK